MAPQRKAKRGSVNERSPKNKGKGKFKANSFKERDITDVFEADDEQQLSRKGHAMDEVDNYEYEVGEIKGEDDEEIDSDEAFDESDDDRFENFKFLGSTKPSDKKKMKKKMRSSDDEEQEEQEVDMNENSSEEESEDEDMDGEDFVDLSAMLGDDDDSQKQTFRKLLPENDQEDETVEFGDSEENDEEDEDEDEDVDEDEDEDMDDKDKKIVSFIDALETKKRKNNEEEAATKRQKFHEEQTEAYEENEFNLLARSGSSANAKKKLDMNDMMDTFGNESSFRTLRQSLLELDGKGKTAVKAPLDAPLPKRIQDRVERQAAYKEANKEISRWQPTVKENREADHLSFPLQAPEKHETTTSAALASKFKAETNLEKEIEEALNQAGMKDEELEAFEALKLNKLSVEEIEERRNELRLMRELMFRHEIKAKRLKKIKSKSYRKLQRKEKEKLQLQAKQIEEIDHELSREEQVNAAMQRAEERMSLKHKNTSNWAKRALARGQHDEGTREAIMEQLRRGEELRRKVHGMDSDDDSNDESDDNEQYTSEKDEITNELAKLKEDMDNDTQPKKGLFQMKFMQDAEKRNMAATKAMLEDFEQEWLDEDDESKDAIDQTDASYTVVENNPGRMAFGSKKNEKKKTSEVKVSKTEVALNDAGQIKKVEHSAAHTTRTSGFIDLQPSKASPLADLDDTSSVNIWHQNETSRLSKKATKANVVVAGKSASKSEQNIERMKKTKEAAAQDDDDDVELDLTNALTIKNKPKPAKAKEIKKQTVAKSAQVQTATAEASDASEDEDDSGFRDTDMVHSSNQLAFTQHELAARVFANDDVVQEFQDEKAAIIEEDGDKIEDMNLPGWGSWGGKGIKKKKNKALIKVVKGIAPENRKDAKLAKVIINEKKNKKTEKYQVTQVPFPFQNMEQYERSLRAPVGREWNTRETFQKMTKPRVMTKLGTVIDPLSAPFR
ncbi:hypothetical protein EC973_001232 [Apophysomyces ossiformis]|uniref:Uncharacterized protein n=1 Tax=Apophysomyces ossiformis TaxID=679940 RepID=A0A8H7BPL0_9FUNG|nr:hypothetical protein EC973_001232 [Apophysomyces ossiformis]